VIALSPTAFAMPSTQPLSTYIRSYDHDLSSDDCTALLRIFHDPASHRDSNGRERRASLASSAWTEVNLNRHASSALLEKLHRQVDAALARYNRDLGTIMPVPNSRHRADFILKRYRPGGQERFQLHFDSLYDVSNRYLVFLWYLNDVPGGGETVFPDQEVAIRPATGRLLVFPPYWLFPHAGEPPAGGDKFILSTYLLFPAGVQT
jgi:prolyl 4-hydroxylase